MNLKIWEFKKRILIKEVENLKTLKPLKKYELEKVFIDKFGYLPHYITGIPILSASGVNVDFSGYFAMLPMNLDLEAHIKQYPLTDYFFAYDENEYLKTVTSNGKFGSLFDKERMICILGLLTSIPAKYKDLIEEDGFVPINSTHIRNHFKDYLSYLDYLVRTGIVICNGQYTVGKKSLKYKYAPLYDNVPLQRYVYYSVKNGGIQIQPIEEEVCNRKTDDLESNPLQNFPHLSHWYYQNKLAIDDKKARKYAWRLMRKKIANGYDSWDVNRNKWSQIRNDFCKKHPKTQYNAIIYNIEAIVLRDYKAKIDLNVHRLHSVITNMQKDFRNFLTYDGQQLVSIDIKNSQPYLMCLLFNPLFWQQDSNIPLNIGKLPPNIQSLFTTEHLGEIQNHINKNFNENVLSTYIERASNGVFYEYIRDKANETINNQLDRDKAKTMMLIVFFSKNRFFHQKDAELKRLFNELFPQIYGLIKLIKSKDHAAFACLLQSVESEVILHRCCKRIWDEANHQIPVFTIHDSIATTIEHQDFVKHIMEEELTRAIGITPSLKIEAWREEELDQEILSQIRT